MSDWVPGEVSKPRWELTAVTLPTATLIVITVNSSVALCIVLEGGSKRKHDAKKPSDLFDVSIIHSPLTTCGLRCCLFEPTKPFLLLFVMDCIRCCPACTLRYVWLKMLDKVQELGEFSVSLFRIFQSVYHQCCSYEMWRIRIWEYIMVNPFN